MLKTLTLIATIILGFHVIEPAEAQLNAGSYGAWSHPSGNLAGWVKLRDADGDLRISVYHDGGRFVLERDCQRRDPDDKISMIVLSTDGGPGYGHTCGGTTEIYPRDGTVRMFLNYIQTSRHTGPTVQMYVLQLRVEQEHRR